LAQKKIHEPFDAKIEKRPNYTRGVTYFFDGWQFFVQNFWHECCFNVRVCG